MRNLTKEVIYWIMERENIRIRKERGDKPPWTKDPILKQYRFCNVRREDDAVTRWLAKNWRAPNYDDPHLPRAMVLARLINWPPTLKVVQYPTSPFDYHAIIKRIQHCERNLPKAWSGAYVVSTNGRAMSKAVWVSQHVSANIPSYPTLTQGKNSLVALYNGLLGCMGMGSFMAAQIVADVKNTDGHPLYEAKDWGTWAAEGPGSIRGIRRYFRDGLPYDRFLDNLRAMADEVRPHLSVRLRMICMQDWQNVMCEFDKYQRAWKNEGRPKANYSPNPDFA